MPPLRTPMFLFSIDCVYHYQPPPILCILKREYEFGILKKTDCITANQTTAGVLFAIGNNRLLHAAIAQW